MCFHTFGLHPSNYFADSFESGVFDPLRWRYINVPDSDASWEIERQDPNDPATASSGDGGDWYAEARTEYVARDRGSAALLLEVSSPNGGTLSYAMQAMIMAPFEDVIVELDGAVDLDDVILSAMPRWEVRTLEIPPGSHEVRWVHRKNPGDMSSEELETMGGHGAAGITRIDDVVFIPR